jgi:hypothetical protein
VLRVHRDDDARVPHPVSCGIMRRHNLRDAPPACRWRDGYAVCPTIASDGQPCNAACDVFAECFSPAGEAGAPGLTGACSLLDNVACR